MSEEEKAIYNKGYKAGILYAIDAVMDKCNELKLELVFTPSENKEALPGEAAGGPSSRQIAYANNIARGLHIEAILDACEFTNKAYQKFIRTYERDYKDLAMYANKADPLNYLDPELEGVELGDYLLKRWLR